MKFKLIAAICKNRGIGKNNALPWHYSKDLKYFAKMTKGNGNNAVVMGNNTYKSIVNAIGKPLPNRKNLVLSKDADKLNNIIDLSNNPNSMCIYFKSINDMLFYCLQKKYDDVWIIGGHSIYSYFLNFDQNDNIVDEIHITEIDKIYDCDTFLPELPEYYNLSTIEVDKESDTDLCFKVYVKKSTTS